MSALRPAHIVFDADGVAQATVQHRFDVGPA